MRANSKKKILIAVMQILVLIVALSYSVDTFAAAKINKKTATVVVGKTITLKITGTKKAVKWYSSNKRIATVSKTGKVKGKKPGRVTITAKAGKKTFKCKVTVKQVPIKAVASAATKKYNAGEYSITKTHSGEATYYDRISTGACNLDYLEKNYYTVAMNNEDYMNGLAGAYIEITDKDGDKIKAVVTDRLPEGAKGDVDLTRKTFEKIEPLATGRMKVTWKIVPFPTKEPISYVFKPTSSQYWAEIQVRNGRYPIKKVEYYDKNSKRYVELEKQEYNYYTAPTGMGQGPYKFRVTDFYGHVLIDSNISMNSTETPVKGKANFPY